MSNEDTNASAPAGGSQPIAAINIAKAIFSVIGAFLAIYAAFEPEAAAFLPPQIVAAVAGVIVLLTAAYAREQKIVEVVGDGAAVLGDVSDYLKGAGDLQKTIGDAVEMFKDLRDVVSGTIAAPSAFSTTHLTAVANVATNGPAVEANGCAAAGP